MANKIKQLFRKEIDIYGAEWIDKQPVLLGDLAGTILTETPGTLYARMYNGKVIKVYNAANVPAIVDLHVIIGRKKSLPTTWQIIQVRETYGTPAASGQIGYHHEQHEFPGSDTVWIQRKQVVPLTVLVYDGSGFIVTVLGSVIHTATGVKRVASQNMNLSAYVITAGAKYVSIEVDDSGVLSAHDGTVVGSRALYTDAIIPVPDPGKYLVAYISFYETQTELVDDDIAVPFPLSVVAKSTGLQISQAAADTPLDADKFGFWDVVDSLLKSITWGNVKATLKTYFDTLYSVVAHTHAIDASIVTYTPVSGSDWTGSVDPGDADNAFDQLASRVTVVEAGGGGGGGSPMVYEDLSSQIPAAADHYDLISAAVGEVLLFYNTTLQSIATFTMDGDGLGLTTSFSPILGDTLIAVYGISGVLAEVNAPPSMKMIISKTFR